MPQCLQYLQVSALCICKNNKKALKETRGIGRTTRRVKGTVKDDFFFDCFTKHTTNRHIKGTKVERVLGKEEVSEKYSMLQRHGWHRGQIQSWSNMQLNEMLTVRV